MAPLVIVLVPGIIGGLVVAAVVVLRQRLGANQPLAAPRHLDPISTDIINVSSIKVAGVGGLGLVAMAAAVALGIPRIAQTEALGLGLGILGATIVILWRRRTGPLPSSQSKPLMGLGSSNPRG